ncbi:PmeII family type II restriction endonuclease [Winogradskyella immobilis]|uniref:Restriction endonuclease n=1 Tax=Winogradskyella immobilis TaxID=2816852 RepID=A0ABS8EJC8_9FLAO|nr:PmeII family type II restriction endonuclease [Winogradskyella immobilis]MCC1483308.1 restriction endonuclease [Winogradskyella immobilis]MCG0015402.1 restriction endonuclease [Winogradskyella immobilis]
MSEKELLSIITNYFEKKIFDNHKINALKTHSQLKSYKINPIIVKYLSKILEDDFTAIGIAKALYYPRILGTSINTSFGTRIQNMFVELELAEGSLIKGMDIEFIDKIDNRKKWCQLKSGPNTINSEDVKPLLRKFSTVTNLARTNSINLNNSDLILGVLYGEEDQLSQHYKKINEEFPVIIGKEFWHRITGFQDFYEALVSNLDKMTLSLDTEDFFKKGYMALAKEIESSDLFDLE